MKSDSVRATPVRARASVRACVRALCTFHGQPADGYAETAFSFSAIDDGSLLLLLLPLPKGSRQDNERARAAIDQFRNVYRARACDSTCRVA